MIESLHERAHVDFICVLVVRDSIRDSIRRTTLYRTNARFTMRLHNDFNLMQDEFGRIYKHAVQWGALTHILSDIPSRLLGDMEFIFKEVQSMLRLTNVKQLLQIHEWALLLRRLLLSWALSLLLLMMCCFIIVCMTP